MLANIISLILVVLLEDVCYVFLSPFYRTCNQHTPKLFNIPKITVWLSDIVRNKSQLF